MIISIQTPQWTWLAGALTTTKARHYPALPFHRFLEFLERLALYRGRKITRIAVQLSLLTLRSSELRFACWSEFDLERALWRIPAKLEEVEGIRHSHRGMKMKEEHIVPLSSQALAILYELRQISGDHPRLFPGDHDARKVMSENTVNTALRTMGYDTKTEVCGHGFRTMARGDLGESGLWSDDMMAAHRVPPQMMGVMPSNTGGFGDVEKASHVFVRNELIPLQKRLQELNDWLEEDVIQFLPYSLQVEYV